ncbi:MAG: S-layer homology domain-containing protein [Stenomitos frigidus ULC029]
MIASRIASLATAFLSLQAIFAPLELQKVNAQNVVKTLPSLKVELTSESNNTGETNRGFKHLTLISQANKSYYQSRYATSIKQAKDVKPNEEIFLPLQSAIERYGIVRLYSDETFKGSQPITRFEAIDTMGAALTKMYLITDAIKECSFPEKPKKPFKIPVGMKQNSFYFPAYKILAEASGNMVYLEGGSSRTNGNEPLTRGDFAVVLNRYLLTPIEGYVFPKQAAIYERTTVSSKELISQATSVSQIIDISPSDWYYEDIQSLVERWGSVVGYRDRTWRPKKILTRAEFISDLNASLDRVNELITAASRDCAKSNSQLGSINDNSPISQPEPDNSSSIAVPIRFTFNTPGAYSRCVEDILQLYQERQKLQRNGRTSDCLAEVFQTYTEKGLSRNQAFELIQAANTYATTTFSSKLYPPKGQRLRIQKLFDFVYRVDASK